MHLQNAIDNYSCIFRITSLLGMSTITKAFFHYFLFFQQILAIYFIIHLKSSFLSGDVQINFFPSFPYFADSRGQFMMSWIGLHKLADVIFGLTQKSLYITSYIYIISLYITSYIISYITNKGIFLNLFCNLKNDWSLVPRLLFFMIFSIKMDWAQRKYKINFFKAFW